MRNLILLLIVVLGRGIFAQELYISPLVGIKADINHSKKINQTYDYFKTYKQKVYFGGFSPLILGIDIQLKVNKNFFGIGAYFGDQAGSKISLKFITNSTDPYHYHKRPVKMESYASWNVFKIPLSYKRELVAFKNKNSNRFLSVSLNTGVNLMFLKTKGRPEIINPIGLGTYITSFGDKVAFVSYAGCWGRSFSVSFNLGLDFDFYIKNKRRITLQLYYEQGTRNLSFSPIYAYKNGDFSNRWFGVSSASRGSSIHLKLAFPIRIFSFNKEK